MRKIACGYFSNFINTQNTLYTAGGVLLCRLHSLFQFFIKPDGTSGPAQPNQVFRSCGQNVFICYFFSCHCQNMWQKDLERRRRNLGSQFEVIKSIMSEKTW